MTYATLGNAPSLVGHPLYLRRQSGAIKIATDARLVQNDCSESNDWGFKFSFFQFDPQFTTLCVGRLTRLPLYVLFFASPLDHVASGYHPAGQWI
jgi:hypothetical protein